MVGQLGSPMAVVTCVFASPVPFGFGTSCSNQGRFSVLVKKNFSAARYPWYVAALTFFSSMAYRRYVRKLEVSDHAFA